MGGIPELIEEGKTGLLFKAGDYKDLESKLRYLLENKAVLDEFTQNCKAVKFETPQSYYEKILRIYGEDV
jgi:glycosyltransferase involved in cell wall biosynthesis